MSDKQAYPETSAPIAEFHDERIDMAHWFPTLRDLDVPTPESQPLPLEWPEDDGGPPTWDNDLAAEIVENMGGEAFVRSGYKSAQLHHSGSHIQSPDPKDVHDTIAELLSQHVMMQMPLGESLWFREWLDLNFCAYARENLVPEVRVFIQNGEVVCHHPRLEGFGGHEDHRETAEEYIESGWSSEHRDETVGDYAERVAAAFDGCWSVDFVMDRSGDWWCTDMALDALYQRDGEWMNISEHPGDCPHDWENDL